MDEKKKLYDAIGYEDHQNSSSYPEEVDILFQIRDIESLMFKFQYVDIDLSIRLKLIEVNVWSNIDENSSQ